MTLTGEQMWFFRHNGFLRLTEKLPTELVERTKEIILRDIREEIEPVRRDKDGLEHALLAPAHHLTEAHAIAA